MRVQIIGALSAVLLTACVTVPSLHTDELTPSDIARNIKCELADAVWHSPDRHAWLDKWNGTVTLFLKVYKKGDASGELNLAIPLDPGSVTPTLAFGVSSEATRTVQLQFFEQMSDLRYYPSCGNRSGTRLLESDLGVREWLDSVRLANYHASIKTDQIDYTVDFLIKKNLAPSARFSLIPIGERIFGANAKLDLQAQYTHNLKLVLKKPAAKTKPEPLEVVIVADKSKFAPRSKKEREIEDLERERDALTGTHVFGTDEEQRGKRQRRLDELDAQIEKLKKSIRRTRSPTTEAPSDDGVPESEKRRLNEALGRSLSTDIREQLRERGVDVLD